MDKYSKTLSMLLRVPVGIFCILVGLALLGVSVWVSTFSDAASISLLAGLMGGGFMINYGVGYAFLGDEYKISNYVTEGHSTFRVVETPKFLKRRKVVTLIGFIGYILLAVYYVARIIFVAVNMEVLVRFNYNANIVALIVSAIVSLFIAVVFFLVYKKTKHIDLGQK